MESYMCTDYPLIYAYSICYGMNMSGLEWRNNTYSRSQMIGRGYRVTVPVHINMTRGNT